MGIKLSEQTDDALEDLRRRIAGELKRRAEGETEVVYVVDLSGIKTWFKDQDAAKAELIKELGDSDFHFTKDGDPLSLCLNSKRISAGEYAARPDVWYQVE